VTSKEAYTASKEADSAEVLHELIWVTGLRDITCVAVCCSVLQCVAVCCSVLQCIAVCGVSSKKSPSYHEGCNVLECVAVCVAVCCSMLRSVC